MLAIIAATVIPQTAAAISAAKEAALLRNLKILRLQIDLYKVEHGGKGPHLDEDDNLATANFVARLTGRTDPSGKLNETGGCGPYLKGFPANVFAETAAAQVIQFDGTPDRQSGWYYHTTSNTIYANVGEEHLPFNYGGADLVGTDIKTLIATP